MPSLPPMRHFQGCFYFHANQNVMFRELSALICAIPLKSLSVSVKNPKRFYLKLLEFLPKTVTVFNAMLARTDVLPPAPQKVSRNDRDRAKRGLSF